MKWYFGMWRKAFVREKWSAVPPGEGKPLGSESTAAHPVLTFVTWNLGIAYGLFWVWRLIR
jgi:hypothetical protein